MLGHKLRNPLALIRTGLDLLDQARKHPAFLESLLPMMHRQVSHLTRLTDDLLDMSRLSWGSIELRINRRICGRIGMRHYNDAIFDSNIYLAGRSAQNAWRRTYPRTQ